MSTKDRIEYDKWVCFFTERADATERHSDIVVDILKPAIYSLTNLPRLRRFPVVGTKILAREGKGESWIGYYPYILPWSRPRNWRHFGERLFLEYVKKRGMPDAIWCAGVLWPAFLANHLRRKYGVPYFIVEHANGNVMDDGARKARRIKGEITRLFEEAKFNAALCTVSADRMRAFLGPGVSLQLLPNTLSKYFEQPQPNCRRLGEDPFVLHNIARMDNNKNHAMIIDAFAQFCKTAPTAQLNIVGTGANYDNVKRQISNLNLEGKVNLLGYLGRKEVAARLRQSSALICASSEETFNNTIIEAMACGAPCISTDAGVARDAIDDDNGIVVGAPSADNLLRGMQHVYARRGSYSREAIRAKALQNYTGANTAAIIKKNLLAQ